MKQRLLVMDRSRKRALDLTALNRFLFDYWPLFLSHCRIQPVSGNICPSTPLKLLRLLMQMKYLQLCHLTDVTNLVQRPPRNSRITRLGFMKGRLLGLY